MSGENSVIEAAVTWKIMSPFIFFLLLFLLQNVSVRTTESTLSCLVILDSKYEEPVGNIPLTKTHLNTTYISVDKSMPYRSLSVLLKLQGVPRCVLIVWSLCDSLIYRYILDVWKYSTVLCSGVYCNEPGGKTVTTNTKQPCTKTESQPQATFSHITAASSRIPIGKVLNEIVDRNKWSSVTVLHDTQPASEDILHELTSSNLHDTRVIVSAIWTADRRRFRQALLETHDTGTTEMKTFLLIGNESTIIDMLTEASQVDDRTTGIVTMSSWLVILPHSRRHVVEELSPRLDNLAVVSYPEIFDSLTWQNDAVLSTELPSTVNSPIGNTTLMDSMWYGSIQTLLYKDEGRVLSRVAAFDNCGQLVVEGDIFPNIKAGFNGRQLIASTKEYNPFVYIKHNGSSVTFDGLCVDLLSKLSEALNFTFQLIEAPDDQWGTFKNGTWDGLIRQLQFNEVDLVVASLTVREDRESVMDFTYPFFYDAAGAIFKRPGLRRWATLLKPFKKEVLLSLGAVVLSITVLLFISERGRSFYKCGLKEGTSAFEDSFWYIWGTVLKHGSSYQPTSVSGSILVIFLSLFCIIISAAYSGNLIAFLTITRESVPFRTSTEIADQSQYKWGTINGSLWQLQIANSNDSDFQRLWQGMSRFSQSDPDVLASSSMVHKKKVEEGGYVFFSDRSVMELWIQDNCELALLEETFRQITFGVGLPNHSPYLHRFSKVLMQFEKAGLLSLLKRQWWRDNNHCKEDYVKVKRRVIELDDIQSAFYVLFIGLFLGFILLIIEFIRYKSQRNKVILSKTRLSRSDVRNNNT